MSHAYAYAASTSDAGPPRLKLFGHGGSCVPFRAVCNCPSGRRKPPIRLDRALALYLVSVLPSSQPLGSYRCGDCGGLVDLTVGAVDIAAPATSARL